MIRRPHFTEKKSVKLFKHCDVFREPIQLLFDGQETYSTYCGAFTTFFLAIVCIVYCFYQVTGLLDPQYPRVVTNQFKSADTELFLSNRSFFRILFYSLFQKDFTVVMLLRQGNTVIQPDPSVFSIQASYVTQVIGVNTSMSNIQTVTCESAKVLYYANYYQINVEDMVCLDFDDSVSLLNNVDLNEFKFIEIELSTCQNNTQFQGCQGQEQIDEILNDRFQLNIQQLSILQVFYTNNIITFSLADNYFTQIAGDCSISYNPTQSQSVQVELQAISILSNPFYSYDGTLYGQSSFSFYNQRQQVDYIQQDVTTQKVIIGLGQVKTVYKLKTDGMVLILSNLGGMWNFLVILFGFLVQPFRNLSKKVSIVNRIFLFEPLRARSTNQIVPETLQQDDPDDWPKIRLGPLEFFAYFLPKRIRRCIRRHKINQIEYAQNQIGDKLDIVYLLKKLNQLDQLIKFVLPNAKAFNELTKRTVPININMAATRSRSLQLNGRRSIMISNIEEIGLFGNVDLENKFNIGKSIDIMTESKNIVTVKRRKPQWPAPPIQIVELQNQSDNNKQKLGQQLNINFQQRSSNFVTKTMKVKMDID